MISTNSFKLKGKYLMHLWLKDLHLMKMRPVNKITAMVKITTVMAHSSSSSITMTGTRRKKVTTFTIGLISSE
jgi:hypothetical protein